MSLTPWKLASQKLMHLSPSGFATHRIFCGVLDYIHLHEWQGACHSSSVVMHMLLAEKGVSSTLFLGEVFDGNSYFDHSWIEIDGEIYDAAISKSLDNETFSAPVFRGIDLATRKQTYLKYGLSSGQGYDQNAQWVRSISISEYANEFPDHPEGLFGIAKLIGKSIGIRVSATSFERNLIRTKWSERP